MVGLSKNDIKRTFNTYAIGRPGIDVDDCFEMFGDMDENFHKTLEEFKVDFEQLDTNKDGLLNFEEVYKLYKMYNPTEEY